MRVVAGFVIGVCFMVAMIVCTLLSLPWVLTGIGASFIDGSYAFDAYMRTAPITKLTEWETRRNGW